MGGDYLTMWEQCLQKFVDFGGAALTDNRRGDGTLMAQDGNEYETLNWTGLTQSGKHIHAQYKGVYDGKTYYRLEIDRTGENAQPEDGLYSASGRFVCDCATRNGISELNRNAVLQSVQR
mgnify:FL=1